VVKSEALVPLPGVCGIVVIGSKKGWTTMDEPKSDSEDDSGQEGREATEESPVSAVDAWLDTEISDPILRPGSPEEFCLATAMCGTP
jgi:hypothetical protein